MPRNIQPCLRLTSPLPIGETAAIVRNPLPPGEGPLDNKLTTIFHSTVTINTLGQCLTKAKTLTNKNTYIGDFKQGKYHGFGTMLYANGDKYEGNWKRGKPHGQGTKTWVNNNQYIGHWIDGKPHGLGTLIYYNGDKYEGEWRESKPHGRGTFTWACGSKYEGLWENGKEHGQGILIFPDNKNYSGEWRNGEPNGKGTLIYSDGSQYEGEWSNTAQHGKGILTLANGDTYDGLWEHNKRHGKGILTQANGNIYEGDFVDDKRHGKGIFIWTCGETYDGLWEHNKRHGQGIYTWSYGSKYDGLWEQDKKHGHGTIIYSDGDRYTGPWTNDWPEDFAGNPHLFTYQPPQALLSIQANHSSRAIILESTYDHNDALGLRRGYNDLLSGALNAAGYTTQTFSFDSKLQLERLLQQLERNIDLVYIRAHGSGPTITCGVLQNGEDDEADETTFSLLIPSLNQTCSIVFESCDTGKSNLLAQKLCQIIIDSNKSPTIVAPDGAARFRGFYLDALAQGKLNMVMLGFRDSKIENLAKTYPEIIPNITNNL